ncbi:MAG: hypothetical protein DRJ03_19235 [Chloroflexi bacterium]|nr:MAG: hypothetical protein DRJ03_19235 [Chloroflexota bacterium]
MAYATTAQLKSYLGIKDSDTFTASAATDILALTDTAISWTTGAEVIVSTTDTLPDPLAADTIYYVIYSSALACQLATTKANADAGTAINLTDAGTGTHTIQKAVNDDTLLGQLLDRATSAIESYTGWIFEAASDTRYFDSDAVEDSVLWVGGDLVSITTLTNGDDDGTEISSDDYRLLPRNDGPPYHAIQMLSDTTTTWEFDVDGEVSILGSWGYSASPPDDIVHACIRLAAYFYRQKDAQVFDVTAIPDAGVIQIPQGIPADVRLILSRYPRYVS